LAGAFGLAPAGLVERARVQCRYGRVVARFDRVLASGMGGTLDGVEKEIPIPLSQRIFGIALGYEDLNDRGSVSGGQVR
jgi:hypothetical protein